MKDPISEALHAISGMARKARLRDRLPEEHRKEVHLLIASPHHQGYDDREDESLGVMVGLEPATSATTSTRGTVAIIKATTTAKTKASA